MCGAIFPHMQYMRKCDEVQRASAGPPAVQFVLEDAESSRPREDVYTMRRKILGDEGCCPHVGLLQAMLDRTRTATSSARAIGRSKAGPSLRWSAGAKLMITRTRGPRNPLLRNADRTRSLDSWIALSGNPTSCIPGSPGARSTSTVTGRASRPCSEALRQRASI